MHKKRLVSLLLVFILVLTSCTTPTSSSEFSEKASSLWSHISSWQPPGDSPAGKAGNVVFFSVTDGNSRAKVIHGTGETLQSAWNKAVQNTDKWLSKNTVNPYWVKVDIVSESTTVTKAELKEKLLDAPTQSFFEGLAFDSRFKFALLESELNAGKVYDYENGAVNYPNLNNYLSEVGVKERDDLPEKYISFKTASWFMDEDGQIIELKSDDLNSMRRDLGDISGESFAQKIITSAKYLSGQVKEDGSFVYGYYPRSGDIISGYSNVRHAGTIWSLIQAYSLSPDEELAESIRHAIDYLLSLVIYDEEGRGFVYETDDEMILLGGNALAVLALVEYNNVFRDNRYEKECLALGDGILYMQDAATGGFNHEYDKDLNLSEAYRTIFFDGEAEFALCRLYGLTKDEKWLNAACCAMDYFIEEGYGTSGDHWISYATNEITKYVTDRPEYWKLGAENIKSAYPSIQMADYASPTALEQLMAAFEMYDRAFDKSILSETQLQTLLELIRVRVEWADSSYFYPEIAMYMKNPLLVTGSFMLRTDGFENRIDDVQHNIGGCYLYQKNYDKLMEYGFMTAIGTLYQTISFW